MQRFLFGQRSSKFIKRKRTTNEHSFNFSQLPMDSEEIHTSRELSVKFFSPKKVTVTPPLASGILETLGLHDKGINSFSCSKTDPTSSFNSEITRIDQKTFANSEMQNSSTCSARSDTQCEYSSAKDYSNGMSHIETCTEFLTIDTSQLHTIPTGSFENSLPSISTGRFTPSRAAPTPQHLQALNLWHHCYCHDFSSPPGGEDTHFNVPYTTGSKIDLAFSMLLSPQSTVKTQSYPQGQAFTRRDSLGGWNFTWVPKQCS